MLDAPLIERLLKNLKRITSGGSEFTVEANPESLNREKLKIFLDNGVNRLSIGMQSLDERKLKKLGRPHSVERGRESISEATRAGFKNIGVDLMFGVWSEDEESWKKELLSAARLPVKHVSCYELTYEKGTPLFDAVTAKSVSPLEDDVTAGMFETAIDTLAIGGFKQYEVSNFAKPGFECRHNLNYWENSPYIGLGASAVSYLNGVRSKNISDIGQFIRRFEKGKDLSASSEKLSPVRRAKETAAVKIRTSSGIDFKWFKDKTGYDFCGLEKKAIPGLLGNGLVKYIKIGDLATGIVLKRRGLLLCDTVSSALL